MKILITGMTGFVGQNLSTYLRSNGFNNLVTLSKKSLNQVKLLDLINVTHIIHLAGKAHDLRGVSDPDEYYRVNFEITRKLYDAFLVSNAHQFIFISSVKAAADSIAGILKEDILPAPKTHYGKSKLMAEQYIQSQPLNPGKSYHILRPCMIHGPGNKGNLNLLYKFVEKDYPYPFAGFENRRSFLSVENLCFIIKEIIGRNDISSGIYNVSDDQPLSTNDVITILATSIGRSPKLWRFPVSLIKFAARLGDRLHLPLNTEKLNKLTENYVVSNRKINDTLGKKLPIKATEGLLLTAISFNKDRLL